MFAAEREQFVELAEDREVVAEPRPAVQPAAGRGDGRCQRGIADVGDVQRAAVNVLQQQPPGHLTQYLGADAGLGGPAGVDHFLVERYAESRFGDPRIENPEQPGAPVDGVHTGDCVAQSALDRGVRDGASGPGRDEVQCVDERSWHARLLWSTFRPMIRFLAAIVTGGSRL